MWVMFTPSPHSIWLAAGGGTARSIGPLGLNRPRPSVQILRQHRLTRELVRADQSDDVDVGGRFDVPEPEPGLAHALPLQFRDAEQLADALGAGGGGFGDGLQAGLHVFDQGRRGGFAGFPAAVGHLTQHVVDGGRAAMDGFHACPGPGVRAAARSADQSASDIGTESPLSMPA